MKNQLLLLVVFLACFSTGCEKSTTKPRHNQHKDCGCDPGLICTMDYRHLLLTVRDQNGKPLVLDKVISTESNGQNYTFVKEIFPGMDTTGSHSFWSDSQIKNTQKTGEAIVVKGILNNQEVFSRNFTVGHDCCHVLLLEGDLNVTVQRPE